MNTKFRNMDKKCEICFMFLSFMDQDGPAAR